MLFLVTHTTYSRTNTPLRFDRSTKYETKGMYDLRGTHYLRNIRHIISTTLENATYPRSNVCAARFSFSCVCGLLLLSSRTRSLLARRDMDRWVSEQQSKARKSNHCYYLFGRTHCENISNRYKIIVAYHATTAKRSPTRRRPPHENSPGRRP